MKSKLFILFVFITIFSYSIKSAISNDLNLLASALSEVAEKLPPLGKIKSKKDLFNKIKNNFINAVKKNNIAQVKELLEKHLKDYPNLIYVKLDEEDYFSDDPFHYAAEKGNLKMVQLFLKYSADINRKDERGNSTLHFAVEKDNLEMVKFLVKKGAIVDSKDLKNETPLRYATRNNHAKIVLFLLNKGANVNTKDKSDLSPIHSATNRGHLPILKLLIKKGANIDVKDTWDRTPLGIATEKGRTEVIAFLTKNFKEIELNNPKQLFGKKISIYNKQELIKKLFKKGKSITQDMTNQIIFNHNIFDTIDKNKKKIVNEKLVLYLAKNNLSDLNGHSILDAAHRFNYSKLVPAIEEAIQEYYKEGGFEGRLEEIKEFIPFLLK